MTHFLIKEIAHYMKKIFLVLVCLSSVLSTSASSEQFRIGLVLDNSLTERWSKESLLIKKHIAKTDGELIIKMGMGDHLHQLSKSKELIDGYDIKVLIIVPVDDIKAKEIVDYAHSKGVRVIAYSRMILNVDLEYFIGFDANSIGALQAQYCVNKRPHGSCLIIHGPDKDPNTLEMHKGQRSVLDSSNITISNEIHLSRWSKDQAYAEIQEAFRVNPNINIILAANDMIAEAAVYFLAQTNRTNIIVTGLDAEHNALVRINNGTQSMTVYINISQSAKYCAEVATNLAHHKEFHKHLDKTHEFKIPNGFEEVPSLYLEAEIIDKSNLDKCIKEHGLQSIRTH
jgi:ABC-type xylose transport system substrate-binding protein